MASLESSIAMKNRSTNGPAKSGPRQYGDRMNGPTSTGSGGIKTSLSKKNAGTSPSRGVDKTNAYF